MGHQRCNTPRKEKRRGVAAALKVKKVNDSFTWRQTS